MPQGSWLGPRAAWDSVGGGAGGEGTDALLGWLEWEGGCRWVESVSRKVGTSGKEHAGFLVQMCCLADYGGPLPGDRSVPCHWGGLGWVRAAGHLGSHAAGSTERRRAGAERVPRAGFSFPVSAGASGWGAGDQPGQTWTWQFWTSFS